jgi:hypothetical protein
MTPGQPLSDGPAWLTGPAGGVLTLLGICYLLFWLSLPVVVLFIGFGQLQATSAPGSSQAVWITTVLGGFGLDPLGLWALNTTYSGGGFEWPWLMIFIGYLAVGAATTVILFVAPRSLAAVRAPDPS